MVDAARRALELVRHLRAHRRGSRPAHDVAGTLLGPLRDPSQLPVVARRRVPTATSPSPRQGCVAAAVLLLAAQAVAQTTHLVGPGGLAQIRQALAIANAGDTIEVQPGTYAHFDMTVGVTLRALTAGTVSVDYDPAYFVGPCQNPSCTNEGTTRFTIPVGQTALVQGIRFNATNVAVPGGTVKHRVGASGRIAFESCEFRAFDNPAFAASGADLRLLRCTIAGQPSTFGVSSCVLSTSTVSAVDCTFQHLGALFTTTIAAGLYIDNSVVVGSRLNISGANGAGLSGGRGILATAGQVWISDSTIVAGTNRCAIEGASFVTLARTTVQNGTTGCGTALAGTLLGVGTLGVVQTGSNYSLQFLGPANSFVGVFAAPTIGTLTIPEVVQPILLDLTTAFSAGLAAIGPGSSTTLTWAIPAQPAIVGLPIWFQGVTGLTSPLVASPVAGGLAR